jgi:uncharacterized membrane protein YjjB (DUF3815 family)
MGCPASVAMVTCRVACYAHAAMMRRCMAGAMPATMMRHRVTAAMSATMSAAVAATSGGCHSRDHEQRGNCGDD